MGGRVEVGVSYPVLITSPSLRGPAPFSELFAVLHQGEGFPWGGSVLDFQGSSRAGSPLSGLLEPSVCSVEDSVLMEACDRPVAPQPLRPAYVVQDRDQLVCPLCGAEKQLDVLHRPQGCLLTGSGPSRQLSLPPVCCRWTGVSVQSPLLWPLHGPAGFYQGCGSCVSHSS